MIQARVLLTPVAQIQAQVQGSLQQRLGHTGEMGSLCLPCHPQGHSQAWGHAGLDPGSRDISRQEGLAAWRRGDKGQGVKAATSCVSSEHKCV